MEEMEINNLSIELWEKYKEKDSEKVSRWPLLYSKMKTNPSILFIGLNPSFSDKMEKGYSYPDGTKTRDEMIKAEEECKFGENKYKTYYCERFNELAGGGGNWEHIDLFIVREKDSKKLKKMVGYVKGDVADSFNSFGLEQLKIFDNLFSKISPKVVIVNNALASHILKKRWELKKRGDGNYYYGEIPIFFSGMLSSGRVDVYSYERLKSCVDRVLVEGCGWCENIK